MKFLKLLFFVTCLCLFNQSFAGILFSEIFPNTVDDTNMEYIELYNSGNQVEYLEGFVLKDKSGKEFIFTVDDNIAGGEYKRFIRSYTKIILNNSDEELYLNDNEGNLIDSFSYSSSVKGEVIDVLGDDELNPPLTPPLDNGGEEEEQDQEEVSGGNIEVPNIVYTFQSPTYLVEDDVRSVYNCDTNREVCKINLDLRDSFTSEFSYSDFDCDINFGFNSGQENKCNPASVIVPKGTYSFVIKIFSKDNSDNKSVKHLVVINKGYQKIIKDTNNSGKNKNENIIKELVISEPKIIIESGIRDTGECSNKINCKINLKYVPKSKYERCLWEFREGEYDGWNKRKCNPSYVKYGIGNFKVKLKVFEKGNVENFEESELEFRNGLSHPSGSSVTSLENKERENIEKYYEENHDEENPLAPLSGGIAGSDDVKGEIVEEDVMNLNPVITIQGKIGKNKILKGNKITCIDSCSINFDGSNSFGNIEKYSWDFGNGEEYEGINPGYIKYKNYGNYKVFLAVLGENGELEISDFEVSYIKKAKKIKSAIVTKVEAEDSNETYENKFIEQEEIIIEDDNSILYYVLIGILCMVMVVMLLWKEKLV